MKFYDQVTISVKSGKGGDGVACGRREKAEARGGPAGGDGGKGGSVFFVASKNEYTLMPFRYRKTFKAKAGEAGKGSEQYGANASDIYLVVPIGTLIKEVNTGYVLAHLKEDGENACIVEGGKGGIGNIHFKNPSNQYPTMFLKGEPGIKKEILLELQLLGDIALIGTPSVGKSTLINAISNVKAKTASYEFTTLVPNIGVVERKGKSFVMVDIPGLIKGASGGKGLGANFLRHILKARIRTIMLDAEKDIPGINEWGLLLEEIIQYIDDRFIKSKEFGILIESVKHKIYRKDGLLRYETQGFMGGEWKNLLKKVLITVVNKYDVLDEELRNEYAGLLSDSMENILTNRYDCKVSVVQLKKNLFYMSALMRDNIDDFLNKSIEVLAAHSFITLADQEYISLDTEGEEYIIDVTEEEKYFLVESGYLDDIEHEKIKIWKIYNKNIAYMTFVLPRGNDEAELRYRRNMEELGHLQSFKKAGIQRGHVLKIVSVYEGNPDKYILRE